MNRLPFWMHQLIEYMLAFVVALGAVKTEQPAAVLGAAAVILVLAASGDGPLSARPIGTRATHRRLDIAVALVLTVAGVTARSWLGSKATFWVVAGGVLVGVLSWRTDYSERRVRTKRSRTIDSQVVADRAQDASKVAGAVSGRVAAAGRQAWRNRRG